MTPGIGCLHAEDQLSWALYGNIGLTRHIALMR